MESEISPRKGATIGARRRLRLQGAGSSQKRQRVREVVKSDSVNSSCDLEEDTEKNNDSEERQPSCTKGHTEPRTIENSNPCRENYRSPVGRPRPVQALRPHELRIHSWLSPRGNFAIDVSSSSSSDSDSDNEGQPKGSIQPGILFDCVEVTQQQKKPRSLKDLLQLTPVTSIQSKEQDHVVDEDSRTDRGNMENAMDYIVLDEESPHSDINESNVILLDDSESSGEFAEDDGEDVQVVEETDIEEFPEESSVSWRDLEAPEHFQVPQSATIYFVLLTIQMQSTKPSALRELMGKHLEAQRAKMAQHVGVTHRRPQTSASDKWYKKLNWKTTKDGKRQSFRKKGRGRGRGKGKGRGTSKK